MDRRQLDQILREKYIYFEVYQVLPIRVKEFIIDYLLLKNLAPNLGNHPGGQYFDYSFLITPIFKALEGILIHIANGLGLNPEKYNYKLGQIFDEVNLEKLYIDVIDKLENVEELQKTDVKQWLDSARRIMRHFRHNPAHFLGEIQLTRERAQMTGDNALETINQLYKSLIDTKLISDETKEKFLEEKYK